MQGNILDDQHARDSRRETVRPTVWGYSTWTTAQCAQGDVPGTPRRLVQRTDVLVPGLTPRELDRVRRHAARHGQRLTRVERRALRQAVEIRRLRVAPPTSVGRRVLVAMSAVEGVADRLDETQQSLARELLWSALTAVRAGDTSAVDDATAALLRLSVQAVTSSFEPARDEHLS